MIAVNRFLMEIEKRGLLQQVAGRRPLVAQDRMRGFQPWQLGQPQAPLLPHDRGDGQLEVTRNATGTPAPRPPPVNLPAAVPRQAMRAALRPTRVIGQVRWSLGAPPITPLRRRLAGHAVFVGQRAQVHSKREGTPGEFDSPRWRQSGILMDVHRSSGGCRLSVSTTPACTCYGL